MFLRQSPKHYVLQKLDLCRFMNNIPQAQDNIMEEFFSKIPNFVGDEKDFGYKKTLPDATVISVIDWEKIGRFIAEKIAQTIKDTEDRCKIGINNMPITIHEGVMGVHVEILDGRVHVRPNKL